MNKKILWFWFAAITSINAQIGKFCTNSNTVDQVCTLTNRVFQLQANIKLQTDLTIIFDNTIMECHPTKMPYCNVWVQTSAQIILKENSTIKAKQVILEAAQVIVDQNSSVKVTGMSNLNYGTQTQGRGGSYIGQGGSCLTTSESTYGNFDSIPDLTDLVKTGFQVGSMGTLRDSETNGGGRLLIIVDSLQLNGTIEANGLPQEQPSKNYSLSGGSGGYIYISTKEDFEVNEISPLSSIEANGGLGILYGNGGSGGIIIFDHTFTPLTSVTQAIGGLQSLNSTTCGTGAAGTIFQREQDLLLVDNFNQISDQKTFLIPLGKNEQNLPQLSDTLILNSKVQIQSATNLYMNNLIANETISFGTQTNLTLTLGSNITANNLDFTSVTNAVINADSLTLKSVIFNQYLKITGDVVVLQGEFTSSLKTSRLQMQANTLSLQSSIIVGSVALQATQLLQASSGSKIESLLINSCTQSDQLFACIPPLQPIYDLTASTFLQSFNNQYLKNVTNLGEILDFTNFNVYLVSFGEINLVDLNLTGPKVGMCAPNISILQTTIKTSGQGCSSGTGLGKGVMSVGCYGSGASYGGSGGSPASIGNNTTCSFPKATYSESHASYEGSSGASSDKLKGGMGGGVIWLSISDTLDLSSSFLLVNGSDGLEKGAGAGSGGSIQVVTKSVLGDGVLNLKGGDGQQGGGGGSGGRLQTKLLQNYNATSMNSRVLSWTGTVVLDGGRGQDGAEDGSSGSSNLLQCTGGFSGQFCSPCLEGFYKYDFGIHSCQVCSNKPDNSFYDKIAQASQYCSYQCTQGLEESGTNPECLQAFQLTLDRLTSDLIGLLITGGVFLGVTLIIFIFVTCHGRCQHSRNQREQAKLFDSLSAEAIQIVPAQSNDKELRMKDSEIWGHQHRMYLIGDGSISNPWRVPSDFPNHVLHEVTKDRFFQFIKNEKWALKWNCWDLFSYYLIRIFAPYMADWRHRQIRLKHFSNLERSLFDTFDIEFWQDKVIRTVRLSADIEGTQNAYIDFIDQRLTRKDYKAPQLPMVIMLCGNGTLQTPYKIDFQNDILAKSLKFLDEKRITKILPLFFQNLNVLLDKLSFYKFNRQTVTDLSQIIDFLVLSNMQIFNPLETTIQLYLFENKYQQGDAGLVKQRRRSLPIDYQTLEGNNGNILKALIRFVQIKLFNRKSEIRFGLVIKSTYTAERQNLSDRLAKALSTVVSTQNHESQLMQRMRDENSQQMSLLEQVLLPESKMLDSEYMVHGSKSHQVKICDKSLRAYDLCQESTNALVLGIKKDRRNKNGLWTVLYSTWLWIFKASGRPAGPFGNPLFSLLFAILVTIDITLTGIVLIHIYSQQVLWLELGIPFLGIMPGLIVLAPIWCLLACLLGSIKMLKTYSTMNACLVFLNYPLTIAAMIYYKQDVFYIALIVGLVLNKVLISSCGAKVRSYLSFPSYWNCIEQYESEIIEVSQMGHESIGKQAADSKLARMVANQYGDKIKKIMAQQQLVKSQDQKTIQSAEVVKVEVQKTNQSVVVQNEVQKITNQSEVVEVEQNQDIETPFLNQFQSEEENEVKVIKRNFTFYEAPSSNSESIQQIESVLLTNSGLQSPTTSLALEAQMQYDEQQYSRNDCYDQVKVKYPAILETTQHFSQSSLLPDEENIEDESGSDSDGEAYGIISTSRLRPSSLPPSAQTNYNKYSSRH